MENVQDPVLLKHRTGSWDTCGLYLYMLGAVFGNLLYKE